MTSSLMSVSPQPPAGLTGGLRGDLRLRPLERSDGAALSRLIAQCNTGSTRFHVHRSDPWALGDVFGPTAMVGAFVDGDLVGTAALSWQPRWLHGRLRPVGYLHDLRVRRDFRGQGLGLALGGELRRIAAAHSPVDATPFHIGTVLADNPVEARIATGTGSLFGRPQRIGQTAHIVLPPPSPSPAVVTVSEPTWRDFNTVVAPQPTHGLAVDAQTFLSRLSQGPRAKLGLIRDGELVATSCLLDERSRRQIVGLDGRPLDLLYLGLTRATGPLSTADWLALASAAHGRADLVAFGVDAHSSTAADLPVALYSATYAFGGHDLEPPANLPELLLT